MKKARYDKIIDISLPVDGNLAVWPGSPQLEFTKCKDIEKGDDANDTVYRASVHFGTHIEASAHFIKNGNSIDTVELTKLIGEAYVADIPGVKTITAGQLKSAKIPLKTKRLLLKTDNAIGWQAKTHIFYKDYVALSADAASWVADKGIELIAVDYFSVGKFNEVSEVHKRLLRAGTIILEGINLSSVRQGWYTLICLPMKLTGTEAAPARAILYGKKVRI